MYRYCSYIENSEADFKIARKLIIILTKLVGVMRLHINNNREDVRKSLTSFSHSAYVEPTQYYVCKEN